MGSILLAYAIGTKYIEDPYMVSLVIIVITLVLLVLAYVITRSFDRLAEANRMKSEFVSIVSHQLRSPLSNLKWTLDLLLSERVDLDDKKELEYLKILEENTQRMGNLISDLLTVSRIEQGRFTPRKESISLNELINKIIEEAKVFSKAVNAEIIFKSGENLPKIFGDPSQIKMVITNLLDNAVRYTRNRGKIDIGLSQKGKNLYFEIKDNGVGIPQEDSKYIFQKFFRSQNVLKEQTNGSGLGLYIAKSIIDKAGGKIGFKSQQGFGSTFWFSLPLK